MYHVKKVSDKLNNNLYQEILNTIDKKTYENMFVIPNIDTPKVYQYDNNKLNKHDGKLFKQDILIKNTKSYFSDLEYKKISIIKIEFTNYNWILISICETQSSLFACISTSPELINNENTSNIQSYLLKKNYLLTKSTDISSNFIHELVKVFRSISGRYYHSSILNSIYDKYMAFKNEYFNEWDIYTKWKKKTLGEKIKCLRFIDLPNKFKVKLTSGEYKSISDLTINDNFYYPISNRPLSQWALVDAKISDIKKDLSNINSSTNFGFIANIDTDKIILTNTLIPQNFSPHVNEREVIVEHPSNEEYDIDIICRII